MSAPDPNRGSKQFLRDHLANGPDDLSPEHFAHYMTMKAAEDAIECARRLALTAERKKRGAGGLAIAHRQVTLKRADRKSRLLRILLDDRWRNRAEVCRQLGISRSYMYELIHELEAEGKLPRLEDIAPPRET